MAIEAKVSGLYLSKISQATGKDYFAIESNNVQLINDYGKLRLYIKDKYYVSKSQIDLERYFNMKMITRANEEFITMNMQHGGRAKFFREMDLELIINVINWCGLNPVFQLLKDIKDYEPEIKLVI